MLSGIAENDDAAYAEGYDAPTAHKLNDDPPNESLDAPALDPQLAVDPHEIRAQRGPLELDRIADPGRAQARGNAVHLPHAAFVDRDDIAAANPPHARDRRLQELHVFCLIAAENAQFRDAESEQAALGLLELLARYDLHLARLGGSEHRTDRRIETGEAGAVFRDRLAALQFFHMGLVIPRLRAFGALLGMGTSGVGEREACAYCAKR